MAAATDEEGLVKPYAYVVLKEGHQPSPELAKELQEFVRKGPAPYKYPRWVEFVDALPKTAAGKIKRYQLRVLAAAKTAFTGAAAPEGRRMTGSSKMISNDKPKVKVLLAEDQALVSQAFLPC